MGARFLVLGYEAREHAIAWKLAQSPEVETVYVSPGNLAMPLDAKLVRVPKRASYEKYADFVIENKIDCTIAGDTGHMQLGAVDTFAQRGLPILGAHRAGAMLEGEKLFAKGFMHRHGVPTARHRVCDDPASIAEFLRDWSYPAVLKADQRVNSTKSAVIVKNVEQARQACKEIFSAKILNAKSDIKPPQVLLEEFIVGRELSYTILMDGSDWIPLVPVRDYKRLRDADAGPNTGGMGGYAPLPWLTREMTEKIDARIIEPTLRGMQEEGLRYRGFLYFGIMFDAHDNPWVLEYNTRLGDPEAESTLMLLEDDFAALALLAATGSVKGLALGWRKGYAMSIVLTPRKYPYDPPIESIALPLPFPDGENVKYFGAIIGRDAKGRITNGLGPTACATAYAPTISACRALAYEAAANINKGSRLHMRTDIGREIDVPIPDVQYSA